MEGSQMWITTLVVLCGLSWNSYGQKTFRRACDCEYMVDGKCAYTLLLPSGQRGEGMCPPSGNTDSRNDEMPEDMQQRVNDLHRNYTQLLSMYSSQATMLNQVYSTLIDKLLACPLLQACAMPEINVPTFTVPVPTAEIPGHEMPDVTIPDIDTDMPEMEKTSISDPEMPEITMPDIDVEMPEEVTMPNVEIPVPKCADVCPDLETELESIRMMSGEVDQTIITNVADIANITNQIRHINATLDELLVRVATGNNGGNAGNGGQPTDGGLGNQQPPIPGGGVMPNGDLPGQMGGQNGLNVNLASLALWVNNIINNGALCLKKGPLVSGDDASIPDESITASSVFNDQHIASRVRIHSEDEGDLKGAWCPGEPNIPGQEWIQFDLGRVRTVYGIVTRGRADYEQWVETYMVYYAQELNKWDELVDMLGLDTVIFDGNKNQNSPNYNYFDNPIQARYVRIIPLSANEGQNMCMRADIIGCVEEPTLP